MSRFHLDDLIEATSGTVISCHQELFDGVGSDTRQKLDHQLFVALKGDQFDAHQFLTKAQEQGAAGLLVHQLPKDIEELKSKITIVQVRDTLLALQDLANYQRNKSKAKIIGIAGSNGKTTSKEFCAALLSAFKNVHYSKGSFNNHWGVPFTLLAQPEDAEVSVVEMGMNHENELARLAEIAEPDIVVCTYVGVEHIEYFGNLENIAKAEEEIYNHSPSNSLRIYNLDNQYTRKMYEKAKEKFICSKFLTFSENQNTDVQLQIKSSSMTEIHVQGKIQNISGEAIVPVFGKHNLTNLMTAASVALALGISPQEIWQALPRCQTNWGRNQLVQTESGAQILFDGYNSNPDSMKALMENMSLIQVYGKKIGIFAEMKELGALSADLHLQTGKIVGQSNLDEIWFYGEHHKEFIRGVNEASFKGKTHATLDYSDNLAEQIAQNLKKEDIALVKGSRSMKLERFVYKCRPINFTEKT